MSRFSVINFYYKIRQLTLIIFETVIFIRPFLNRKPRARYSNSTRAPSSVKYSSMDGVTATSTLLRTIVGRALSPNFKIKKLISCFYSDLYVDILP